MSNKVLSVLKLIFTLGMATEKPVEQRPAHWAQLVSDEANLYQIDELLYRGEQPIQDDVALIHDLHIETIINLRFFSRNRNFEVFDDSDMQLVNLPTLTWRVSTVWLANVLALIEAQNQRGKKVLIHCYHGGDRTGVAIAMYRIIRQGWDIEAAKSEMKQGGFDYHPIWTNLDKLFTKAKVAEIISLLPESYPAKK